MQQEGHASCIANEEGERQIACAISYNGEEIVSVCTGTNGIRDTNRSVTNDGGI